MSEDVDKLIEKPRRRGRPKKEVTEVKPKKSRGRPKQIVIPQSEDVTLEQFSPDQKADAIKELWRMGVLSWKLKGVQKNMYKTFTESTQQKTIFLVSRRTGKTFSTLIIALEMCLKNPNTMVKYLCPKLKDAKTIIRPIMRTLLEDCPSDVISSEGDIWKEADKMYQFTNGSIIQIGGTDNGNADSVRGTAAHLVICDEAGFMDDFRYVIRNVLSPTLKTTRGKMLMISTPSRFPTHEFMVDFVHPAEAEGTLIKYTIYDNPMFTKEDIEQTIREYPDGENDPEFRREYLCESSMDKEIMIINNFNAEVEKESVVEWEQPALCDFYVSVDIGFTDLTGVLFGYYDYLKATLVILDEVVVNGPTLTTEWLAETIRQKEKELFKDRLSGAPLSPFLRVMDNNNLVLWSDLNRLHGIQFITTKKDNRDAQINHVKMMFANNQIKIHPRCKTLLYHIKNAKWNKARTDFAKLQDTPNKLIRGGHCDLLAALIYLVRNINKNRNPFPNGYFEEKGENIFKSLISQEKAVSPVTKTMHQIFNFKKKPRK